jgi:preprotein translocase subunit SecG
MMIAAKIVLLVLSVLLVLFILFQSGRSAGLSGVIAGGSNQVSNRRNKGLDSVLSKATVVVAILFFLITMAIAILYHHHLG